MEALPLSSNLCSVYFEHVNEQCKGLLNVQPANAPKPSVYSNGLPEIDLRRMQYCWDSKAVLGHNETTSILHVKVDGTIHAAFKQQNVQTLYVECFNPHPELADSAPAGHTEQEQGRAKKRANLIMATYKHTPGQLLDSQDISIQEASIAMLNAPCDSNVLQTYAVVHTHPSAALEFDGLVPLLQQRQPQQSDVLIVGLLCEFANYGSLSELLRWMVEQGELTDMRDRLAARLLGGQAGLHVARGIKALHEHHILHTDIKPENVMVCGSSSGITCKVGDLGCSVRMDPETRSAHLGSVHGTMAYTSPECVVQQMEEGCNDFQPEDDVFGLGMILAQLLARRQGPLVEDDLVFCWDPSYAPASASASSQGSRSSSSSRSASSSSVEEVVSCVVEGGLLEPEELSCRSSNTADEDAVDGGCLEPPCDTAEEVAVAEDEEAEAEELQGWDRYCNLIAANPSRTANTVYAALDGFMAAAPDQETWVETHDVEVKSPAERVSQYEFVLAYWALRCVGHREERPSAAEVVEGLERWFESAGQQLLDMVPPQGLQLRQEEKEEEQEIVDVERLQQPDVLVKVSVFATSSTSGMSACGEELADAGCRAEEVEVADCTHLSDSSVCDSDSSTCASDHSARVSECSSRSSTDTADSSAVGHDSCSTASSEDSSSSVCKEQCVETAALLAAAAASSACSGGCPVAVRSAVSAAPRRWSVQHAYAHLAHAVVRSAGLMERAALLIGAAM